MTLKITESTIKEINQIVVSQGKKPFSPHTLSHIKSLLYFNAQGDIKASDYYYIKASYLEILIKSYKIPDKSLFRLLIDVGQKINNGYENIKEELFYEKNNFTRLLSFLILEPEKDIIDFFNQLYLKTFDKLKEESIHLFIQQLAVHQKYQVLKFLFDSKSIYLDYFSDTLLSNFFYKDGIENILSPAQANKIGINNIILAIIYNDITSLNIFLKTSPNLMKKLNFESLSFCNTEALTYAKIIYAKGLKATQSIFLFNLNDDLNSPTSDRIKVQIKNMDKYTKEKLVKGNKGKFHFEKNIKENKNKENNFYLHTLFEKMKTIFKKTAKKSSLPIVEKIAIETQELNMDVVNNYFNFMYEKNLNIQEKNILLQLQQVILNILEVGEMSIKIKCDILLILQDKLPKLTQTYLELNQNNSSQQMDFLQAYIKAITLLINQFNLYLKELEELKAQKLSMTFTEQIVFLERKYLSSASQ